MTALDRVNPRARRGGGCVATDPGERGAPISCSSASGIEAARRSTWSSCSSPCSPASCIEADGAASVEIFPEVSRP
ncbi:hypothetical protein [Polyangium jinanense]|uniref:Uncharacterized protein n=1 Tax=Polyangium jinanense TaxID=2829994 RepID=A0A9X3XB80_9BACT|nr:hypothetical protein [Polyangium jinanense]MDC3985798.1 hypothetical protein [Polyangium jinanense]